MGGKMKCACMGCVKFTGEVTLNLAENGFERGRDVFSLYITIMGWAEGVGVGFAIN